MKRWGLIGGFLTMSLLVASLVAAGPLPASILTPVPTHSLDETSMMDFVIADFGAIHSPVNGDANEGLIFGNLSISPPAPDLPAELAAFLGRWEGYNYAPPVKKDWKVVLLIQEITAQGGRAFLWMGTNLQYPRAVQEIQFRVVMDPAPSIEWGYQDRSGQNLATITRDPDTDQLEGWLTIVDSGYAWGPIELTRDQTFYVYDDYAQYLAGKRIYPREYQNQVLQDYGQGYLVYLPEGYEAEQDQTWPLLFFLHGAGDRGDNLFLLAKASPFMMIREKGPLPFIIVAPLLNTSLDYGSFPDAYLDGILEEILTGYRVDPTRIYMTGLSMGGEATYRFALNQPDVFAAIAPLAAFDPKHFPAMLLSGYEAFTQPLDRLKDIPVWAIHGADDSVVPLDAAQSTVDALREAGVDVLFSVLENHDHDVWTDTYTDPAFYEWLLQYRRP
ncbi:MAG: dienelactone hydrolase family protein [Anaerolineae bacterium]|nr:dienelactone hydrolase family protein [Anaerolineae bacterium]